MAQKHASVDASADVKWVAATTLDELWEGEILDVEVEGEPVLLAHLPGGELHAYQGICPHQEILLADGDWNEDRGVLLCAGHNWEFDLRKGAGINPTGCLYRYPVRAEGDSVQVGIPQDGGRHYNRWPAT
ncbi:MAG: Rieske 2Fe-2S domain-containing protein [Acidimicrobiales bacterium]|nr:Rieske 2Fe-2S domain-containing protein [Acidimicrobiales bacterium]